MINLDMMILSGYATAVIVLLVGLIYGLRKAKRGERT